MHFIVRRCVPMMLIASILMIAWGASAQTPTVAIGGNDDLGSFIVAGSNNLTLYTFANDEPGVSNCEGGCLENWPAYTVQSADELVTNPDVPEELGTITRTDGSLQVTLDGDPLYFFIGDQQPGDATGEGAGGVWYVIRVDAPAADSGQAETPAEPATGDAEPAQAESSIPENDLISVSETELGRVLADASGMTLYTFANDEPSLSNCVDRCVEIWPPLLSEEIPDVEEGVLSQLSLIKRDDGLSQVALSEQPLYLYSEDVNPGDVTGQGVGSVWFALSLDLVEIGNSPELGSVLVAGTNDMTLYTFANDEPGVSNCIDRCLEIWPAYTVDEGTLILEPVGISGSLSLIERPDGSQQLALNDQPLYFYSEDVEPGDTTGQGVGSVWFVVSLDTVVLESHPEFGTILTDANGMTLYTFANDEPGWSNCVGGCSDTWPPLTVEDPEAIGAPEAIRDALTASGRADGSEQVNFNDQPLYLFAGDQQPGETNGHGQGGVWSVAIAEGVQVTASGITCDLTPALPNINRRTGPSTAFSIAGASSSGETLVANAKADSEDGFVWFRLEDGSWVRADVVNATPECDALPFIEAPQPPSN